MPSSITYLAIVTDKIRRVSSGNPGLSLFQLLVSKQMVDPCRRNLETAMQEALISMNGDPCGPMWKVHESPPVKMLKCNPLVQRVCFDMVMNTSALLWGGGASPGFWTGVLIFFVLSNLRMWAQAWDVEGPVPEDPEISRDSHGTWTLRTMALSLVCLQLGRMRGDQD